MQLPEHLLCRIFSLIREAHEGILSMKHQTEKPFERIMRFFTPELYLQYNSPNDDEADRAEEAWENATAKYQAHLESVRGRMPPQVQRLSELCLHDAEILACNQEADPGRPAMAILTMLEENEKILTLIYQLWDRVRESPAPQQWPFSRMHKQWMYDELDIAPDEKGRFLHRVLFSDGSVIEFPFVSVVMQSVTVPVHAPQNE
jgi:hypothetical protein